MEQGYSLPAEFDRLQAPSSAYAPRQVITYLCTREHLVTVPFAVEVEVPEVWECRCGQPGLERAPEGLPRPPRQDDDDRLQQQAHEQRRVPRQAEAEPVREEPGDPADEHGEHARVDRPGGSTVTARRCH